MQYGDQSCGVLVKFCVTYWLWPAPVTLCGFGSLNTLRYHPPVIEMLRVSSCCTSAETSQLWGRTPYPCKMSSEYWVVIVAWPNAAFEMGPHSPFCKGLVRSQF